MSDALYGVVKVFYYSAIPISCVRDYFMEQGISIDWERFLAICEQYKEYDLLVESRISHHLDTGYDVLIRDCQHSLVPVMSTPCEAEIHLTHNCNLKCIHCFQESSVTSDKNESLTAAQWSKVFDQFESMHMQSVIVSGGEPMMHPEFTEIIRYVASKKISVMVLTNAMLITDDMTPHLKSANISLSVSVDGHNASIHEILRGKGTFCRLDKNLSLLVREEIKVGLSFSIHSGNYRYLEEFIKYARDKGIQSIVLGVVEPSGRADVNDWLILKNKEMRQTHLFFNEIIEKYSDMKIDMPDMTMPVGNIEDKMIYCAAGTRRMAIRTDGMLFPCISAFNYNELAIGDLKKNTIFELWNRGKWDLYRGNISISEIESCCECQYRHQCNYRNCRLKTYGDKKSLYEKPKYCYLDRMGATLYNRR